MTELLKRTYTGIAFVIVLVSGIIIHPLLFVVVFSAIVVLAMTEFFNLSRISGASPQKWVGSAIGVVMFNLMFLNVSGILPPRFLFAIFPAIFVVFIFELYRNKPNPLVNIAITLTGVIMIALPFSLVNFFIFPGFDGKVQFYPWILMGIFFILWAYDTGAYIFGILFGRFKLFERISPKKSWEGAIGGAIIALVVGILNSVVFHSINLLGWMGISFIVVLFGTFGDLVESMIKRSLNLKDSGNLLPGHGGILDRFDSFIISVPFIFAWLMIIIH